MSIRIIVLDDGETWAGGGTVMEITDQAYDSLCYGNKNIKHLDDNDILGEWDVSMADPDLEDNDDE